MTRPVRLAVRIGAFQASDRGSIPLRATDGPGRVGEALLPRTQHSCLAPNTRRGKSASPTRPATCGFAKGDIPWPCAGAVNVATTLDSRGRGVMVALQTFNL